MSYQALYRVWRPQSFADVVGQQAVVQTLKNALIKEQTSHAYLFTGPRGTGKTSIAKIMAKAINCQNRQDGEPCNACEICRAITQGTLGDVVELDAASHNGVEEIRDIRDKARYAPTQAQYKVYIIDEVHMLSTGAFNALLKTLEEPPANVVFILATTEPHKIPATIISRTQRFDFRQITAQDIEERLAYILTQEQQAFEQRALTVLARAANGGMRDALSLLDQAIAYSSDCVTEDAALHVSGGVAAAALADYTVSLVNNETEAAITQIQQLFSAGKEPSRLVEELLMFGRDMLLRQTHRHLMDEQLLAKVKDVPNAFIYRLMATLNETQQAIRQTTQPMVYLEVMTVKLSESQPTAAVDAVSAEQFQQLQQQIDALQTRLAQLSDTTSSSVPPVETKKPERRIQTEQAFKPNMAKLFETLAQATREAKDELMTHWHDAMLALSVTQRARLQNAEILAASTQTIVLGYEYDILCNLIEGDSETQAAFRDIIQKMTSLTGNIVCVTKMQWPDIRQQFIVAKRSGQLQQYVQDDVAEQSADILPELDEPEEEAVAIPESLQAFADIVEITD